uniref:peptidylprolyl isomerase n=1 Tax=Lepeophtheirus salmonis TaxID=72036 RepID=A0A0K2TGM7_LEPSM
MSGDEKPLSSKRSAEEEDKKEGAEDDEDDWIGPLPSEASVKKRPKILEYEETYLKNLPCAESYEKSFMHRDSVLFTCVTASDFVITASVDGHVKFWKKHIYSIEFVKHFRAHLGSIADISVNNPSGTLLATISLQDEQCKVFDVVNFDMINMIRLNFKPSLVQWIHKTGDPLHLLAITERQSNVIRIFDGNTPSPPLKTFDRIHFKTISAIAYSSPLDMIISGDSGGIIEYWTKEEGKLPSNDIIDFDSKLDTDLYEFAKRKTYPLNICIASDGKSFASFGADRIVRVFKLSAGKLFLTIDESLRHYINLQTTKKFLPPMEFNKKLSVEKDMEKSTDENLLRLNSIIFDKSGHFILYSSMLGIKVVNIVTGKCVKVLGRSENVRFLNISLFQGIAKKTTEAAQTMETIASDNPALDAGLPDPTLFVSANKKNRFYLFTRRAASSASNDGERDIFNEKPSKEDIIAASEDKGVPKLYTSATIHTSVGDIHIQLFAQECPKSVENFATHSKNGYYNGHIFHRVIKQFMIQTGDPTGIGTGGESIWGGEFEDEFNSKLKHDRPYTVSMANAGPNTNGSQFFMTVVPTPWLDNKHTVFGRVVRGMEVAQNISNVKTHPKTDKPYNEITIISITLYS